MHENKKCAKCTRSFWCVENIAEYCQGFKVLFEWLISSEKKLLDCELNTRQFIVTTHTDQRPHGPRFQRNILRIIKMLFCVGPRFKLYKRCGQGTFILISFSKNTELSVHYTTILLYELLSILIEIQEIRIACPNTA